MMSLTIYTIEFTLMKSLIKPDQATFYFILFFFWNFQNRGCPLVADHGMLSVQECPLGTLHALQLFGPFPSPASKQSPLKPVLIPWFFYLPDMSGRATGGWDDLTLLVSALMCQKTAVQLPKQIPLFQWCNKSGSQWGNTLACQEGPSEHGRKW